MNVTKDLHAELQNDTYDELIVKRQAIIQTLLDFEAEFADGFGAFEMFEAPSPETIYQNHNEALITITKLINEKFNAMING